MMIYYFKATDSKCKLGWIYLLLLLLYFILDIYYNIFIDIRIPGL